METPYITDPVHGGKVTCHKCNGFIREGDDIKYFRACWEIGPDVYFHKDCYNDYEHYYGLDKPVD